MIYILIIIALVFLFLLIPLNVKVQVFFDAEEKRLYYSIKLVGMNIYSGFIRHENGMVLETNFLKRTRALTLEQFIHSLRYVPDFGISLFNYAKFYDANVFVEVGSKDSIYTSVMATGVVNMLLSCIAVYIQNYHNIVDFKSYVITKNHVSKFECSLTGTIRVSILGIICSLIHDIFFVLSTERRDRKQKKVTKNI